MTDGMERAVEAGASAIFDGSITRDIATESVPEMKRRIARAVLTAALPLVGVEYREDYIRAMCHSTEPCACANEKRTYEYSACKIVARHAAAVLALPKHTGQPQEGWRLSSDEEKMFDGALDVAVNLARSENEQHKGLGQIIAGVCAIIHKRVGDVDDGDRINRDGDQDDLPTASSAALANAPQAGCAKEVRARLDQALSGHTEFSRDTNLSGQYLTDQIWHIVEPLLAPPLPVAERGWQPIETAPRTGECVLVAWDDSTTLPMHVELGRFRSGTGAWSGWCNTYGHAFNGSPTHWMPLPAPPLLAKQGEKS